MTVKAPMKDLIIILPGILGSVLQKDGKDLWNVSGQSIFQVWTNLVQVVQDLKLSQDDQLLPIYEVIKIGKTYKRIAEVEREAK